ncbi:CpsD/CapB family tyrosine-protein kinase [Blautia sp. CLA-JM-H16]|uniref:non-specific protein-tyrosine kinase n=1 Tax=Blautia aquisgranensis TaxID=3133153 RepID=A0ABV1BHV8_9FIRM
MSALRTRVEKEMREKNLRTILISSSLPGEGKTTVSLNLALSLAQRDKKVLLIDGDLRNPSLHTNLNILQKDIKIGITDVLKGKEKAGEAIINFEDSNLDLILGRKSTGNASELLSSHRMQEAIDELVDYYDYVIIDTPPAAMMADASVVAAFMDAVLYVIRQDYAKVKYITEGIGLLADSDAHVLGCVLNCAENGFGGYGKYGKYGYGYTKYSPEDE